VKAFAKKVRVAVIMVGLLTVVAATTNLSGARAEDVKRSPPACGFSVSDDEWGRNMPEYGWIHNYVVNKKKECEARRGSY